MPAKAQIRVHFLPHFARPEHLLDTCVAIDVLRATTCIVEAIGQGAAGIYPCEGIDEAREAVKAYGGRGLLAGERGGRRIPGFDLGNSPVEFSQSSVAEKWLGMTTTNGTRAIAACWEANRTGVAAFTNLSAVVEWITSVPMDVDLVCAGTEGGITLEDVLLAGAITDRVLAAAVSSFEGPSDAARIAADLWRLYQPLTADLLALTGGGRNLIAIGAADDVEFATQVDRWAFVPQLRQAADGRLVIH